MFRGGRRPGYLVFQAEHPQVRMSSPGLFIRRINKKLKQSLIRETKTLNTALVVNDDVVALERYDVRVSKRRLVIWSLQNLTNKILFADKPCIYDALLV